MASSGYCAECSRLRLAESAEVVRTRVRERRDYLGKKDCLMVYVTLGAHDYTATELF